VTGGVLPGAPHQLLSLDQQLALSLALFAYLARYQPLARPAAPAPASGSASPVSGRPQAGPPRLTDPPSAAVVVVAVARPFCRRTALVHTPDSR